MGSRAARDGASRDGDWECEHGEGTGYVNVKDSARGGEEDVDGQVGDVRVGDVVVLVCQGHHLK